MSSIDDIDDDITVQQPVQPLLSVWARKKLEREQKAAEEAAARLLEESQPEVNNDEKMDKKDEKKSTIFSRLKQKLTQNKLILPKEYDERIEPSLESITESVDITKQFYSIQMNTNLNEMELELIRLVAFYRAACGDSFERILQFNLTKREKKFRNDGNDDNDDNDDKNNQNNYVSRENLPFLQTKHPHYPLLIQYTYIYKHIIKTMENTDKYLAKLRLDIQNTQNDEEKSEENTQNNENNKKPTQNTENPLPNRPNTTESNTSDLNSAPQVHPSRARAIAYEEKIIKSMNPPPSVLISHLLSTPEKTLMYLMTHAKHQYRDILTAFHEQLAEQIELTAVEAIDWKHFTILDTIKFLSQSDEILFPEPCKTISELKNLFSENENYSRQKKVEENAKLDEIIAKKRQNRDIDDIDDDIDSYLASSRGVLSGHAAGTGSNSIHETTSGGVKRKPQHQLPSTMDDDDEANLDIISLNEAQELFNSDNNSSNLKHSLTTKCEICGQNIPINELSEHMKIELSNPDWIKKKTATLSSLGQSSGVNSIDLNNLNFTPIGDVSNTPQQLAQINSRPNSLPTSPYPGTTITTATNPLQNTSSKIKTAPQPPPPPTQLTSEYLVQQHQNFINRSGNNDAVPLPPGIGFAPPLPPGMGVDNINIQAQQGNKRPNFGGNFDNPNAGQLVSLQGNIHPYEQPQQQSAMITYIDAVNNVTKMIEVKANELVDLEDEKPLSMTTITPINFEHVCLYEDHIYTHTITIQIPNITTDNYNSSFNFNGQIVKLVFPTLRVPIGAIKRLIQDEILNGFEKRIKLNTSIDSPRPNIFLNNDKASLAAYQIKDGYTLIVSLQKYAGK
jgi:hypothetical protein